MTKFILLAATALLVPTAVFAQATTPDGTTTTTTTTTTTDATVSTTEPVAAPAPAASEAPALCTDRPTKATSACTVPKGMVQIETDLINFTRLSDSGFHADTILWTNPTLKFGLGEATDIQFNIAPYETIRLHGQGLSASTSGVGDLYIRLKQRLTPSDAKAAFAIVPYIKIPTAKTGIGNRKVEGGLVGTGVFGLDNGFTLTITPEIDALLDSDGHGRHAQFVGALNLGKTLSSKLTAYAELWTAQNRDPAGHLSQYSADFALAYLAGPTLQYDVGVNFGLNRVTPDVQAYVGISTRF